ncbi:MAG: glycosyltransferase family 2 protein [Eubacteriales bacterium]
MKKVGIYETMPLSEGDIEGGIRLNGQSKNSTVLKPLLTYITVVYNRKETILNCMESIWKQSYDNIEYIIVDGASTDGTLEIILENKDKIDYFISQPDTGIYNAMNKGVKLAKGELICFMNSDDACVEGAAEKVISIYNKTKSNIICGNRILMQDGKELEEIDYPRYAIKKSVFHYLQMYHQSTYATREVFEKTGYFKEEYSLLADWIWQSQSIDNGFDVCFVDDKLSKFSYDGASCQGILKRDLEWEQWASLTFPNISIKDLQFFIYCLDKGRHPLFDLAMMNKVAFKYMEDKDFFETYYRTILLIMIEECHEILDLSRNNNESINKMIAKQLEDVRIVEESIDEIKQKLMRKIREAEGLDNLIELNHLCVYRRCLNKMFWKIYLRNTQLNKKLTLDSFLRIATYGSSRLISKSIFFSRRFYPCLRSVWNSVFSGKYVKR